MQRERVTDDIYVFTSDLYVQVTAGVILTNQGAVVIDTLPYPEETRAIKRFVEDKLGATVRYVINTHFHADHTTGTCFFKNAQVISHKLCRDLLDQRGRESMEITRSTSSDMQDLSLVLPNMVFDGKFTLYLGDKVFKFWHTPGHSPDSIVCLVEDDQILFGADTVMPIPYFVDGNFDDFLNSLRGLQNSQVETIIQGHGEVILRGEVEEKLQEDIEYLNRLSAAVDKALMDPSPDKALVAIDIEQCGKSRVLLNGAAGQLHRQNVFRLADYRRERSGLEIQNRQ
ncbi:MAG TPA: MBL fold metallo-hydrolase [Phototrophicaceae bacterium]|jgi:glyoxylase-like metal-dependent hydrolase (beta-lactamase superfamily II)|nr:MBL fold metallo-hydrolase [Phototrophicaceae bacterium]